MEQCCASLTVMLLVDMFYDMSEYRSIVQNKKQLKYNISASTLKYALRSLVYLKSPFEFKILNLFRQLEHEELVEAFSRDISFRVLVKRNVSTGI